MLFSSGVGYFEHAGTAHGNNSDVARQVLQQYLESLNVG